MDGALENHFILHSNNELPGRHTGNKIPKKTSDSDIVNKIIDYLLNGKIPIDIKTCQIIIQTGQEKHPTRPGRFMLVEEEHKQLIAKDGYYLFIVKADKYIHAFKLIEAWKIPYKQHLQWNKIIERA